MSTPAVALPGANRAVRVIAGEYSDSRGPARTFTAMDVWDISLRAGGATDLTLPAGPTVMLVALRGAVRHGPFVVNTAEQIRQTVSDFQSGRFVRIGLS